MIDVALNILHRLDNLHTNIFRQPCCARNHRIGYLLQQQFIA